MKHKLTHTEREARTDRRAQAREAKITRRQAISDWFDARVRAAEKRRTERAKARAAQHAEEARRVEYVVQHHDANYATRRAAAKRTSRRVIVRGRRHLAVRPGSNQPHINPARDTKPGARLRKELR